MRECVHVRVCVCVREWTVLGGEELNCSVTFTQLSCLRVCVSTFHHTHAYFPHIRGGAHWPHVLLYVWLAIRTVSLRLDLNVLFIHITPLLKCIFQSSLSSCLSCSWTIQQCCRNIHVDMLAWTKWKWKLARH